MEPSHLNSVNYSRENANASGKTSLDDHQMAQLWNSKHIWCTCHSGHHMIFDSFFLRLLVFLIAQMLHTKLIISSKKERTGWWSYSRSSLKQSVKLINISAKTSFPKLQQWHSRRYSEIMRSLMKQLTFHQNKYNHYFKKNYKQRMLNFIDEMHLMCYC